MPVLQVPFWKEKWSYQQECFPSFSEPCNPLSSPHTWIWVVKPIIHDINIPIFTSTELLVAHYIDPCRGLKKQKTIQSFITRINPRTTRYILGRSFFKASNLDWCIPILQPFENHQWMLKRYINKANLVHWNSKPQTSKWEKNQLKKKVPKTYYKISSQIPSLKRGDIVSRFFVK